MLVTHGVSRVELQNGYILNIFIYLFDVYLFSMRYQVDNNLFTAPCTRAKTEDFLTFLCLRSEWCNHLVNIQQLFTEVEEFSGGYLPS